jgi:hypothetical protein
MTTKELILNSGDERLLHDLEQWNDGRNAVWQGVIHIIETNDFVPVQMSREDDEQGGWFIQDAAYDTIDELGQEAADEIIKTALASMDHGDYKGIVNGIRWELIPRRRPLAHVRFEPQKD